MSLTSLWKSQKDELLCKSVQAKIGLAGDGKVLDGGKASQQFRKFLTNVLSLVLAHYAKEDTEVDDTIESGECVSFVARNRLGELRLAKKAKFVLTNHA